MNYQITKDELLQQLNSVETIYDLKELIWYDEEYGISGSLRANDFIVSTYYLQEHNDVFDIFTAIIEKYKYLANQELGDDKDKQLSEFICKLIEPSFTDKHFSNYKDRIVSDWFPIKFGQEQTSEELLMSYKFLLLMQSPLIKTEEFYKKLVNTLNKKDITEFHQVIIFAENCLPRESANLLIDDLNEMINNSHIDKDIIYEILFQLQSRDEYVNNAMDYKKDDVYPVIQVISNKLLQQLKDGTSDYKQVDLALMTLVKYYEFDEKQLAELMDNLLEENPDLVIMDKENNSYQPTPAVCMLYSLFNIASRAVSVNLYNMEKSYYFDTTKISPKNTSIKLAKLDKEPIVVIALEQTSISKIRNYLCDIFNIIAKDNSHILLIHGDENNNIVISKADNAFSVNDLVK